MKSEWKTFTVQELIDSGLLEEPMDGNHGSIHPKTSDYVPVGVPFVMANNLINGRVDYKNCAFITQQQAHTLRKGFSHPGDVLLTHKATLGRTAIVSDEYDTIILTPQVTYYRTKPGLNNRYLKYYFDSRYFQELFSNWAGSGSTRAYLGITAQRKLPIVVPPFEIQCKIADICGKFDDKIELNQKINENLERQAQAIFRSWFVDFEPWNGVQPSEWDNAPLGTFVDIKRGGSPRPIQDYLTNSGLRWLKISDVTSLNSPFILNIKEHIRHEGLHKTVFLNAGELVLSNSATPGIPKILDVDSCIHDGWLYFPKSQLSKYYLYLFFKYIRKELLALGNGSVFTNLKTDILKAYPVVRADNYTLKEFDKLVKPLFEEMLNMDRENSKLSALRDALLPKLMSGEIDVSDIKI